MPDLVGLPYAEGGKLLQDALDAAGNEVVVQARTRVTRSQPPGTYVGQSPAPGTPITSTTHVWVYVEAGRR